MLVGVGLYVRLSVEESPVFRALRAEHARSTSPIVEVFRERPRALVVASVSFIANTAIGYVFLAYLLSYGTSVLKVSRNLMLLVVIIGSVSWLVSIVAAAIWSDRIGRRPVYLVGSVLLVLWSFPFFLLVDSRNTGVDGGRGDRADHRPRRLLRARSRRCSRSCSRPATATAGRRSPTPSAPCSAAGSRR